MEAGDHLPTLGRSGALRILGAALHFLSSSLLDARRNPGSYIALEISSRHLRVACALSLRVLHVSAGPRVACSPRRHLRRRVVRRESISPRGRLLAECIRRTVRWSPAPVAVVLCFARGKWPSKSGPANKPYRCRGMADEYPLRRDGELLARISNGHGRDSTALAANTMARRLGGAIRSRAVCLLHPPGSL